MKIYENSKFLSIFLRFDGILFQVYRFLWIIKPNITYKDHIRFGLSLKRLIFWAWPLYYSSHNNQNVAIGEITISTLHQIRMKRNGIRRFRSFFSLNLSNIFRIFCFHKKREKVLLGRININWKVNCFWQKSCWINLLYFSFFFLVGLAVSKCKVYEDGCSLNLFVILVIFSSEIFTSF